jgi:opacity protein-like surface antigen
MRLAAKVCVFLVVLLIAAQAQAKVLKVSAEKMNLRAEPTMGAGIVITVPKGTLLGVLEEDGYWIMVKVLKTGEVGYIHQALVDARTAAPPMRDGSYAAPSQPEPRRPPQPPQQQPVAPPTGHAPPPEQAPIEKLMGSGDSQKNMAFTLWGGLLNYGDTYPNIGGTLGFYLNDDHTAEIEVGGDYSFVGGGYNMNATQSQSVSGYSQNADMSISQSGRIISISGGFNYNFLLSNTPIRPYAGGGVTYGMFSGNLGIDWGDQWGNQFDADVSANKLAFSLGGGVKFPIQDGRKFLRGDVRVITYPSTAFNLRVGVVF